MDLNISLDALQTVLGVGILSSDATSPWKTSQLNTFPFPNPKQHPLMKYDEMIEMNAVVLWISAKESYDDKTITRTDLCARSPE